MPARPSHLHYIYTSKPLGALLGISALQAECPDMWPMSGVVASALLSTPIVRHLVNLLGVREAGSASIKSMFEGGFRVSRPER